MNKTPSFKYELQTRQHPGEPSISNMTFFQPLFFFLPSSSLQTLTNLVDHVLGTSGPKMVHHAVRLAGRHGVVQDDRAEGK